MPLLIPSALVAKKNALYQSGGIIELLEFQVAELPDPLRLTPYHVAVEWGGYTWIPFAFQAGDVGDSIDEIPQFDLLVSNVSQVMEGYVRQTTNWMVDDQVVYRAVHSELLGEAPFLTEAFKILATKCDPLWVYFTLGQENFFNTRFPRNEVTQNLCKWPQFGDPVYCRYVGAEIACDRTLAQCIARSNVARFKSFPGLLGGAFNV